MTSKTKRILCGTLTAIALVVALDSVYLLGYRHGSRDALDRDSSAVVESKVIEGLKLNEEWGKKYGPAGQKLKTGEAMTTLKRRVDLRPVGNVNTVPITISSTNN